MKYREKEYSLRYPNPKDYTDEDGNIDYEAFDHDVDAYEEHR